jgi:pimeloyl-ACP methyl ester carboxylesterase
MTKLINSILFIFFVGLLGACGTQPTSLGSGAKTIASTDGSLIRYEAKGQGRLTIVFVHCWTCNHSFWTPQLEHFAKQYQVVWVDLAGHGESSSHREQYTMQSFGQDIAAVVQKIDAKQVVLVGHSMGGPVALEAAKLLGDRAIGIVGVDTFYTPFIYPTTAEKIEAFAGPFRENYAKASQNMVQSMFTPDADGATRQSITSAFPGADKKVGVSALYEIFYWNAEQGDASRQQFADRLYNINAAPLGTEKPLHKSVVLVPGVGHFIPQVKPDVFNRILEEILDRITSQ